MFQPNIRQANFLLAKYLDEYPAGWCLVEAAETKLDIFNRKSKLGAWWVHEKHVSETMISSVQVSVIILE